MGKGRHRRREQRRERAQAPKPPEPPLATLDLERVVARFRHLSHRGLSIEFVSFGPEVGASSPEELTERTDKALIAETLKQRPS